MDDRIDELYGVPLSEFVSARNALAKELRVEEATEDANRVASLRKPTMVAWALNQAARSERDAVERLLGVHNEMRESPSAAQLRSLSEERQRLVAQVTDAAVEALEGAGHAGAAARDRISLTVLATGTDLEAAETLRAGRLTTEKTSSSAWEFLPSAPTEPADAAAHADDSRRVELDRARRRLDELNERAATLEDRAGRLEHEAEEAQRRAAAAREAATSARGDADRQAEEVADLDEE